MARADARIVILFTIDVRHTRARALFQFPALENAMADDYAAPARANRGGEVSDYYFLWTFVLHVAYAYC